MNCILIFMNDYILDLWEGQLKYQHMLLVYTEIITATLVNCLGQCIFWNL